MEKPFICEAKNHKDIRCTTVRTKAHIVTRQFREIKNEPMNAIFICTAHQKYFNTEVGKQEWPHFIRVNFPQKYAFVCSRFEFILNEYLQFLKGNTFVPTPPEPVSDTPEPGKQKKPKPAKPKLCTHSCHTLDKDWMTAYCWDCRDEHSAYNVPLI